MKIIARQSLLTCALSFCAAASFAQAATPPAPSASAAQWRKEHPRRAEVNARLANQNRRIDHEEAKGEISQAQANKLHRKDRQIRQEERDMASQNGGHITRQEQATLNQQENKVSGQIGH